MRNEEAETMAELADETLEVLRKATSTRHQEKLA